MIIVLKPEADDSGIDTVTGTLDEAGYGSYVSRGEERTIIGAIGTEPEMRGRLMTKFRGLESVEQVLPVLKSYKLVSLEGRQKRTTVKIGDVPFGPGHVSVIAGPCAVESEEQTVEGARRVKEAGGAALRGGAYKPRTSPYDFQGIGEDGLKILATASGETGLPVVTEARAVHHVEKVVRYADAIQIGARNMQNFQLLKEAGKTNQPVLLKRGFGSTVEEWLKAAEYVASNDNLKVILCERGIRTFGDELRFTSDLGIVPRVQQLSHLPVVVDPSHSTGKRRLVGPVARAGVAVGGDGVMVEVTPDPESARCDSSQQMSPDGFKELMREIRQVASAIDKMA
ncbi:MAG: 3-deoxy-7-phosphoheptulonate synthase [Planctomycetota bacterium]